FAVPALISLISGKYEVVAVYTQPDKPSGRGQAFSVSPVKKVALNLNLPVMQPENFRLTAERERFAVLRPEAVVVAAYGVILPKAILETPSLGCLNLHPSLLPKYRGTSPVTAAILNGDEFTGVSIMLLDKGVDTGPVLIQAQVPVTPYDTTGLLTEKLSYIGAGLLLDVIPRLRKKEIVPRAQDNSRSTYTRMLEKTDGEIDWSKSAAAISRQVRAYQPWPGSYTRWQDKQLKILEAMPVEPETDVPGQVVSLKGNQAFGIQTGNGVLAVTSVQLEGKKVMSAGEFIRGQRQLVGTVLPN
ncbi:MAG: methionyl-tRNA formyltransferase, partial [Dehalococcoidales bacterium]|nr:methionyl-tRNA formyltransferase [Dehalococcoidales bacterium]